MTQPDLTRAYFWPAVNQRPTGLWPWYFLTQPDEIFLIRKEKIAKFGILGVNGWPEPTRTTKNWPDLGKKILTQTIINPNLRWNWKQNKDLIQVLGLFDFIQESPTLIVLIGWKLSAHNQSCLFLWLSSIKNMLILLVIRFVNILVSDVLFSYNIRKWKTIWAVIFPHFSPLHEYM